jgi:hypothetical protein
MKKLFISLFALSVLQIAHAQSSYDYIKAICDRIISTDNEMTERFKDTLAVRRIETGILSTSNEGLSASTERTLFSGKTYLVYVFTDRRVMDLKMNVYSNSNNEWHLLKTVDKNQNTNKAADNMYGDYELYALAVDSTMDYKVEIAAPAGNAAAARYGMIIWSKDAPTTSTPTPTPTPTNPPNAGGGTGTGAVSTYFSTESKKTCYWDANTREYRNCQDEAATTLFVLNPNKTVFKHTTDNMSSSYFVQSTSYADDKHLTSYEVVSDAGNKYTFMIPDDGSTLLILNNTDPNNTYYVKYTIRRRWTQAPQGQ